MKNNIEMYVDLRKLNTISIDGVDISITEEDLYYIQIKSAVEITLEKAKEIIAAMIKLGGNKKLPALIECDSFSLPTKEAREFLAEKNASPNAISEAYVIKSTAQKIVGNFYLQFDKPGRPTKMFNEMDKAIEWLENERNKAKNININNPECLN